MKKLVAIIIILVSLGSTAQAVEIYPRCGIIVDFDYDTDIVVVEDSVGFIWEFYGIEDYCIGDLVIMTLCNVGEPEYIIDDEIIEVVYGGYNFN